jgi:hypothetical protein
MTQRVSFLDAFLKGAGPSPALVATVVLADLSFYLERRP